MDEPGPTVIRATDRGAHPAFLQALLRGDESAEQLHTAWAEELSERTDWAARDTRIAAMERLGLRPDVWIERRMLDNGLYPDIDDPEFASRLFRKTEFASLSSTPPSEETCSSTSTVFETTPVQRLIARFLHPSTPYNGILLNHGVGVGKTCSAVTVAETYLETLPYSTVYIVAPQAIAEGFRRTIFDASKLVPVSKEQTKLTGERWTSPQCTGMTYPRLTGTAGLESREAIQAEVDKRVRKRYNIMGYLKFANWVKNRLAAIPATITGEARKDREREELMRLFSDHLIIIDEAHNLRDVEADSLTDEPDPKVLTDAAEGKALTPILWEVLRHAEGLRLMLMTATPMYNTAPEILFLMKLLKFNDTKDESTLKDLETRNVFQADGSITDVGRTVLAREFRRYVSYMRGENPNTFPLRLTPPISAGMEFLETYPAVSISKRFGAAGLSDADKQIMGKLPLIVHTIGDDSAVGAKLRTVLERRALPREERAAEASDVTDSMLDEHIQIANITYPNTMFGTKGFEKHFKESTTNIGGSKVKQYTFQSVKLEDGSSPSLADVFGPEGLQSYAPKMAAIVESISRAKGMSFIYSRYVKSGAIPLAIALELAGWCRVLADGTPAPLLARGGPGGKPKHYYIILTSDSEISPNFKGLLQYATTFKDSKEAAEGTKVKAILGSAVASEGLDLKCIRELHLLDGWYHLNRIEQIEGRGVRFCSHALLPKPERNCLLYLHAINIEGYETADLYAYRLAARKAQPIGTVTRLMKEHAWDCMLNIDAILLSGIGTRAIEDAQGRKDPEYDVSDQDYTSFCDFAMCGYGCAAKKPEDPTPNNSTYKEFDYRVNLLKRQVDLAQHFASVLPDGPRADDVPETSLALPAVYELFYKDLPVEIAAVGLREALGHIRIKRTDGIYGTLVLKNGFIVFQPDRVTDTHIPLAMRYGRAFGRLPRTVLPARGSLMQTAVPVAAEATENGAGAELAAVEATAAAAADLERAMASLTMWRGILNRIITEPSGKIDPPAGFNRETFSGLRWVYNHFGMLAETVGIGCRWWMENIWTTEERIAVFSSWLKKGPSGLSEDETFYANLFKPIELFFGEFSGFLVFDVEKKNLLQYCFVESDPAPAPCTEVFRSEFERSIGRPVDRKKDTGPFFGMLVSKKGTPVFKSVDKAAGALEGAECANNSKLLEHLRRIHSIQVEMRRYLPAGSSILPLLLGDDLEAAISDKEREDTQDALKARYDPKLKADQPEKTITHIKHMSLKQICPYMEFILRIADIHKLDGKRWFLSLVDSARAGAKMT
jgi:hypothetical protein